jgi:H+-translocating NAD(P) transhydrogenase subunit beta
MSVSTGDVILEFSYLVSAVLFVIGLKMLSHPETARTGNFWAGVGMGLSILTTLIFHRNEQGNAIPLGNIVVIIVVMALSAIVGTVMAKKVKMTAMPQMVSFFNATGGAASALIAFMELMNPLNTSILVTLLGLVIGTITFTGSMVAYGKLDGKVGDIFARYMTYINLGLLAVITVLVIVLVAVDLSGSQKLLFSYTLLAVSFIYGVTFVMPIGGADMPVVISLLNSLSGIAATMAGFIYHNQTMILGGILVGASGVILTVLMCKAMNRSLLNVIVGAFGGGGSSSNQEAGDVREISLSDASILLSFSQRVVIVPGYGLAVSQAQHLCHDLEKLLTEKSVEVKYAIHPVAGRMPGHMNVLLAEADVQYEKLVEMDDINPEMPNTDVVMVIGANDVVNPAAEDDPGSPIYGMPIIKVHQARNIIVLKRGMGKGYAAIENMLFYNEKTRMLFGDAKATLQKLVSEIKNL